jgi:hypothetical protein
VPSSHCCCSPGIWTVNPDGSCETQLTRSTQVAESRAMVSPDGRLRRDPTTEPGCHSDHQDEGQGAEAPLITVSPTAVP